MNSAVLDASAILAIISREPGYEKLTPELLANAIACAVNLAEVQAKLVSRGWKLDEAWEDATSPVHEIVDFDAGLAKICGSLVMHTKAKGLSLGDRACLATGIARQAAVYTAERSWNTLSLGIRIVLIR